MSGSRKFSVAIVIPALNEEIGLKAFLPQIKKEWYDELIVVDGNSKDGSQAYVREFGATLCVQSGKGYENAITDGMAAAKSDVIIIFSPDGNCLPSSIPLLIEEAGKGYDMVIASRYYKGMKSEDDTILTTFGNWLFTTLINLCFRASYTDSLVNFRAYRRHVVERFLLKDPESIYTLEPAMSIECAKHGLKVSEVYGFEPPRIAGDRKTFIIKPTIRIFRYILVSLFTRRQDLSIDVYGNPVVGKPFGQAHSLASVASNTASTTVASTPAPTTLASVAAKKSATTSAAKESVADINS